MAGDIRRSRALRFRLVHDRLDPSRLSRQVEKVGQLRHEGENGAVHARNDEQEHEQNHEVNAAGGEKYRADADSQAHRRALRRVAWVSKF